MSRVEGEDEKGAMKSLRYLEIQSRFFFVCQKRFEEFEPLKGY